MVKDDGLFAFAGLSESWRNGAGEEVRSVSLITTTPNALVAPVHDRMAVILTPDREWAWARLFNACRRAGGHLRPFPAHAMKECAVSPEVNRATYDGPELLDVVGADDQFGLEAC